MGAQPNVFTEEDNVIQMTKVPTIKGKQFIESNKLETMAGDVIEKRNLDLGPAQVGYLLVYPNISKYRGSKTISTSSEVKHYSGNDYLVEVSGEMWDMLDDETREILLWHQLLHIDPQFKAKKQEWTMKIRKPDFHDFYVINDKLGNTWYKTIQSTVSSLYDLDPRQEEKVRV